MRTTLLNLVVNGLVLTLAVVLCTTLATTSPRSATTSDTTSTTPSTTTDSTSPSPSTAVPAGYAGTILTLVNRARSHARSCGSRRYPAVAAVSWDGRLGTAARRYARRMADDDFFSHTSPDGQGPGDRISAAGYTWSAWRENIAAGQKTARQVMKAWLDSPTHCADIMAGAMTDLGVGRATSSASTYGTYWVQDLATP